MVPTHKEPTIMGMNPFCQEFEYGTSADVYWTYDWMVLQLEDCTNILKAIHTSINLILVECLSSIRIWDHFPTSFFQASS